MATTATADRRGGDQPGAARGDGRDRGRRGDGPAALRHAGCSRADQAVTASRSRSISSWSGTSIARPGTTRAANMAPTSSSDQATAARRAPQQAGDADQREDRAARDHPDPQALLGALRPAPGRPPAVTAPRERGDADDHRQPLDLGSQTTANAAAAPNAGAASDPVRGEPADRQHADDGREHEQPDGHRRAGRRRGRAANQPASTATAAATQNHRTDTGPGGAEDRVIRWRRSGAGSPAGPADGRHEQGRRSRCRTRPSTMSAGSGRPIRVQQGGYGVEPGLLGVLARDVERGGRLAGHHQVEDAAGPVDAHGEAARRRSLS